MKLNWIGLLQKVKYAIHKYRFFIFLTLGIRTAYSVWIAFVWFFVEKWFPQTEQALWETYHHLAPSSTLLGRAFIDVWLRWDAVHYMNIAAFGYQGVGIADTVWPPLYPYLVGGLAKVTGLNVTLVGILISSLATLFALICLYELVNTLFQDENLARGSTTLLAVYPTALFFHAPFSDALFLCLATASFLMMIGGRHLLAGVLACAAALTRSQGVLLLLPMAVIYVQAGLRNRTWLRWREIPAIIIAPLGLIGYSWWRKKWGHRAY